MDILVVCNRTGQLHRLFQKFVAIARPEVVIFAENKDIVRWREYDIYFITKDKLDICKQGRRNVEVIRAADLEAVLDRHYGAYKGEKQCLTE